MYPCLNVRTKAIKALDENMGGNLHNFGLDNSFLDMKIDKLDLKFGGRYQQST